MSNDEYTRIYDTIVDEASLIGLLQTSRTSRIIHDTDSILTFSEIKAALSDRLFLDTRDENDISVGNDNATNALYLQGAFEIPNVGNQRIFNIYPYGGSIDDSDIFFKKSGASGEVIINSLPSSSSVTSTRLMNDGAIGGDSVGGILIFLVTNVGIIDGSAMIRFTVVQRAAYNLS